MPSNTRYSAKCGSIGLGLNIGLTMPYLLMPSLIRSTRISRKPAISMAPQNVISPSPCDQWMSPIDRPPPLTYTGKYTREPRDRFLMSQLPPCSRGGTVRHASAPALRAASPLIWPISAVSA
ncbi:Uncharacterised protein [Bordetella pertussis]|nr:Uncharacterised protein [Bordetella pertussis]